MLEARYARAESLGALLPVGRRVRVGSDEIEIVATMADSTTTAIFYRADRQAGIHPELREIREGHRSGHGTLWRDMHVDHLEPPVDGDQISVVFNSRPFDDRGRASSELIVLPIDRSRTAPYEQAAIELPEAEAPGVHVRVTGAHIGITMTMFDMTMEGTDPADLAVVLATGRDGGHVRPRGGTRPGPEALWRQWIPPDSGLVKQTVSRSGSTVTTSISGSLRVAAKFGPRTTPSPPDAMPAGVDEEPVELRAMPGNVELEAQGSSSQTTHAQSGTSHGLRFDAPGFNVSSLELALKGIYRFTFGSDAIVHVPGPRGAGTVDLNGLGFDWGGGRIELLEWRGVTQGDRVTYSLWLRCPDPRWLPDVRVLAEDSSTSLWLGRFVDGIHRGGLPPNSNPLLERDEVPLALRMVGLPADELQLSIPMEPVAQ